MLHGLTRWMVHWASTPGAEWALFWLAVAESSFFPIPVDVLLIAMGLASPAAGVRFGCIATIGSVVGAVAGYYIGVVGGRPVLRRWVSAERLERVEQYFQRYEAWAIGVAGFTPVPYKVFTIAAGIFRATLWKFVAVSFLSRGARFVGEGLLFYLFGEQMGAFIERYFNLLSIVLVLLLGVGAYAISRRSRVRSA
jgi:membrane protein YqaA with SNARE-associated domain